MPYYPVNLVALLNNGINDLSAPVNALARIHAFAGPSPKQWPGLGNLPRPGHHPPMLSLGESLPNQRQFFNRDLVRSANYAKEP